MLRPTASVGLSIFGARVRVMYALRQGPQIH
jgi:hypothetical protein